MKKVLTSSFLAVLATLLIVTSVLAAYYADIALTNSSATDYSMLSCNVTANVDYMAANDYFSSINGTDTRVVSGTAEVKHMLASDRITFALPVNANSSQTLLFTTHNSDLTTFPIVLGYNGYVTVADAANIELSTDFVTETLGWVDTSSDNPVLDNLIHKQGAIKLYISGAESITSAITAENTEILRPDGDDAITIPLSTGGGTHFDDVDEAVADDGATQVWTTNDASVYTDWYSTANTAIPVGAFINDVTLTIRGMSDTGASLYFRGDLKLGSETTIGTQRYVGGETWTTFSETMARPGGGQWQQTDFNALLTGVTVKAEVGAASNCNVTQVFITITYETITSSATATGISTGESLVRTESPISLYLDGSGDRAVVTADAAIANIFDGGGTVIAWIKPDSDGENNRGRVYDKTQHKAYMDGEAGGFCNARFSQWFSGANLVDTTTAREITIGSWNHLAITYDNGNAANRPIFYVGGLVKASNNLVAPGGTRSSDSAADLVIGEDRVLAGSCFDGDIGGLWLFDTILTPAQVLAHFNSTYDNTNLVGHWNVDEQTGTTLVDSSGNGNNATITNAAWTGDNRLQIFIDDTLEGTSFPSAAVTVLNNANDWVFLENNVAPYTDNLTMWVAGTPELWFMPQNIISGTTLPDRTNAYNHGTITWGSNPTGIAIAISSLIPTDEIPFGGAALETPDVVPTVEMPATMYQDEAGWTLTDDPLYTWMLTWSNLTASAGIATRIPLILMWFVAFLIASIGAFALAYKYTHNLLLSGILAIAVLGYGVSRGLITFWMIIILVFALIGLVIMERKQQI